MEEDVSALLVVVPEAEPLVGAHRAVLDSAALKGVPAHVTALYPFLAPGLIDDAALQAVREAVASVPAFAAELVAVAWFGAEVVYLRPEPGDAFRALTSALVQRFPQCPPYGGEFAEVVPHLTVGHHAAPAMLQDAAVQVQEGLPVPFAVRSVRLMVGSAHPGSWRTVAEFPLG